MSPAPDSTSDDPQQIIVDLRLELTQRTAERDELIGARDEAYHRLDEAQTRETATAEVLAKDKNKQAARFTATPKERAYQAAAEAAGITLEQWRTAMAAIADKRAQREAERRERAAMVDSRKEQLAAIVRANPNAEYRAQDLARQLGLPNTPSIRWHIARQLKLLR
jgi:hypothetical protein